MGLVLAIPMLLALEMPCMGQASSFTGARPETGLPNGSSGPSHAIRLEPDSRIWIEGNAGPIPYSCLAVEVDVMGAITQGEQSAGAGRDGRASSAVVGGPAANVQYAAGADSDPVGITLAVGIPVGRIDCGRRGINEDLRDALKSDHHPEIRYDLQGFRVVGVATSGERTVETFGELTVAGRTRAVTIPVKGRYDPIRGMRIEGSHQLDMTDFDVTPPSPMMGLIKVNREMIIRFDVGFHASGWVPSSN